LRLQDVETECVDGSHEHFGETGHLAQNFTRSRYDALLELCRRSFCERESDDVTWLQRIVSPGSQKMHDSSGDDLCFPRSCARNQLEVPAVVLYGAPL